MRALLDTSLLAGAEALPLSPGALDDLWIAATALAHGLVLVTADERQARLPLVESRYVG